VTTAAAPFRNVWPAENSELATNGPLIQNLQTGEKAIAGVAYHTFGGTNPRHYKMYQWLLDAASAEPQYKDGVQYFVWRVKAVELGTLSPVLDDIRDFADEVVPGRGDGFVTDASARLPWSTHTTTQLNHVEVLWNRPLQQRVAQVISGGR
jgi:hypothetical protein